MTSRGRSCPSRRATKPGVRCASGLVVMIELTLAEVEVIIGGRLVPVEAGPESVSGEVHTDSRKVVAGSIFFALPGESLTDGHLFAEAAVASGAVLLVVERESTSQSLRSSSRTGTSHLRHWLARLSRGCALGAHSRLSRSPARTARRRPRTCSGPAPNARVPPSRRPGVRSTTTSVRRSRCSRSTTTPSSSLSKWGRAQSGRSRRPISIVTPDVGIVLKVGLAHVGEFGGPDAVETAKSEMVTDLPDSAVAVLNADDDRVVRMAPKTRAAVDWFGLAETADVRASDIEATSTGTAFTLEVDGEPRRVQAKILGEHHVMNALATIAAARALGVGAERSVPALESLARAERWRMEVLTRPDGVIVVNDAYNASPDSMAAALKRRSPRSSAPTSVRWPCSVRWPSSGNMPTRSTIGSGRLAVRLNVRKLIVVGPAARHIHNAAGLEGSWDGESVLVATADEAYDVLRDDLRSGDVVLVKSSGSAELRFLGDRIAGVAP